MTGGPNAVARMLGTLGDEWTLLIVQQALLGATRYGDFTDALPVSHSVLSARLRSLVDEDLLTRREYQTRPSRAEYPVTPRSRSLWPMLTSIWEWERTWVTEHVTPLPAMRHASCGADFSPTLTCRACDTQATEKDVVAQWGPSGSWARSTPSTTHRRRSGERRLGAGALFPQTMSVIGDRWGFALLVAAFVGIDRFTDLQTELGAPPGTIAHRLATLTAEGILHSTGGRYRLTEKGRAFFPVLVCALEWAQRWYPDPEGPAVLLTHRGCGRRFHPALVCDQCCVRLRGSRIMTA
ncbi:HxlR family transcriptional regulator [Mycobacterium sp. BK558]|nr:HxlR family transcriptional regulator [Mycobacterium sp. BK558]